MQRWTSLGVFLSSRNGPKRPPGVQPPGGHAVETRGISSGSPQPRPYGTPQTGPGRAGEATGRSRAAELASVPTAALPRCRLRCALCSVLKPTSARGAPVDESSTDTHSRTSRHSYVPDTPSALSGGVTWHQFVEAGLASQAPWSNLYGGVGSTLERASCDVA